MEEFGEGELRAVAESIRLDVARLAPLRTATVDSALEDALAKGPGESKDALVAALKLDGNVEQYALQRLFIESAPIEHDAKPGDRLLPSGRSSAIPMPLWKCRQAGCDEKFFQIEQGQQIPVCSKGHGPLEQS